MQTPVDEPAKSHYDSVPLNLDDTNLPDLETTPVKHAHPMLETQNATLISQNDIQHTANLNDSVLPISHSVGATPMQTPVDEPAKSHYDSISLNLDDTNLPDLETTPVKHAHPMLETQNATLISQNDIQHTATLNDSVLPISHSVGATPMQNPAKDPQSNLHYESLPMNLATDCLMLIQPSSSRQQDIPALLPPMPSQSSPTTNKAIYEYCNDNEDGQQSDSSDSSIQASQPYQLQSLSTQAKDHVSVYFF